METRTPDRLRHHYEVERELAARLLNSTREERPALFAKLYNELFQRVPDHPRLTRVETPDSIREQWETRLTLLEGWLQPGMTFLEFAPGDCLLSFAVAPRVRQVLAVDISDQSGANATPPDNFRLIVYDGYDLALPDATADLIFSYQFLEHLHPEDFPLHLDLAARLLKPGGHYIFATPHRYSGPHDVSRHFVPISDCFHFKEWTYREMTAALRQHGFTDIRPYFRRRPRAGLARAALLALETFLGLLPRALRKPICVRLFSSVTLVATKGGATPPIFGADKQN